MSQRKSSSLRLEGRTASFQHPVKIPDFEARRLGGSKNLLGGASDVEVWGLFVRTHFFARTVDSEAWPLGARKAQVLTKIVDV